MSKKVHILNGDSTVAALEESGILGDIIVWREMLCEGPLSKNIGLDDFWNLRYTFFEDELKVSKLDYFDKTIKELIKIEDLSNYKEVVLWFEFDLFCQVNLVALCAYLLKHYRKDTAYYLICVGKEKNKENLLKLSDYSAKEYQSLYEKRVKLTRHDLLYAKECWEKYVSSNVYELREFNFNKNSKFNYLQLAINQHLKRYTNNTDLNQIDYKLIETINSKTLTEKEIVRELLIWQKEETVYGFGDLQYFKYLEKLHPFYNINNDYYYLNEKGKSFLTTIYEN
jgi:hypothetical protein